MSRAFTSVGTDVDVAASSSINGLSAFTYAAWIYLTDNSSMVGAIAIKDPAVSYIGMYVSNTFGPLQIGAEGPFSAMNTATSYSVSNVISLNEWYRVAATYDDSGDRIMHIYVNGVEVSYSTQIATTGAITPDSSGDLFIGTDTFGNPFVGDIAGFKLWNTALTAPQVASDYFGSGVLPSNLVDFLTFLTNQGNTEPDASGHSNVGVITGAAFSSNNPPGVTVAYSVPDCRNYGNFPNNSVDVNGTLTYTVPNPDSRAAGAPIDSRTAGAPVACGTYSQNSRTPGTFGPGE